MLNRVGPGEIVVDSQRTAELVRSHRALWKALDAIQSLIDEATGLIESASRDAAAALAAEPEFDHLPAFVQVDSSWADALPACVVCGRAVPWRDSLLMLCGEDGELVGIIHRDGCGV